MLSLHIYMNLTVCFKVNVSAYDPSLGSAKDKNVVDVAVAYDCPHTGEVLILKINQAIHINFMEHNLLCVMQCRLNDVKIFDCPKFLTDNPTTLYHSICHLDKVKKTW